MNGFYNAKIDFGAVGDGCADDTDALQNALDALKRSDATSTGCAALDPNPDPDLPPAAWAPYRAGLYIPAGVYRITRPLVMPYAQQIRIFGDGGQGGSALGAFGYAFEPGDPVVTDGAELLPTGTLIRQDTDDAPIFVFDKGDSFSIAIERIGFTWRRRQSPPPDFAEVDFSQTRAEQVATPISPVPGAVGVLFSSGGRANDGGPILNENYFHIRITGCSFEYGFRGVAIDETEYVDDKGVNQGGRQIAVFDTQIDHCYFGQLTGAAISLANRPDFEIGMTSNSVRNVFIQNYDQLRGTNVLRRSKNFEPQIRLAAQAGCTLANVDAEGSKRTVLTASDCVLQITSLYLEHVAIAGEYPKMLFFAGGRVGLHGMNVDGYMYAKSIQGGGPTFSTLINGQGTEIVISGVPHQRVRRHERDGPQPGHDRRLRAAQRRGGVGCRRERDLPPARPALPAGLPRCCARQGELQRGRGRPQPELPAAQNVD